MVNDEERRVLAMFLVICRSSEGGTNLARHREILEMARQNRWLEEACTLELLCSLHRHGSDMLVSELTRKQDLDCFQMVASTINTLAATRCPECFGSHRIFDLFALIGDPKGEEAWNVKEAYARQLFAMDAIANQPLDKTVARVRQKVLQQQTGHEHRVVLALGFVILVFLVVLLMKSSSDLRIWRA
ncbi:unnamed protein product [Polarella glacialis]|uniref:Uncharacterized protein n=1 Tax=Polarella glacialis TaxID=89957 RepID=A0A813IAR1_POLGL|nr:unnamed protein product [Polarella glacialis]